MRRAPLLAATLALVGLAAAAGCIVVTGSTDGYTAPTAEAGSCLSASDCGDGGGVCCLIPSPGLTSVSGVCQAACAVAYPQLCKASAECGDAGACSNLQCTLDASPTSFSLQACGTYPGCVAH